MSYLFGYYSIGLRALNAATIGLNVAGENIANINTPGYSRRRAELAQGYPFRLASGEQVPQGVQVTSISRLADRFVQTNLERELGTSAGAREQLRGLQELESVYGSLDDNHLINAYQSFSDSFSTLAGAPTDLALRSSAIASADRLAQELNGLDSKIRGQISSENQRIGKTLDEINQLAKSLAQLNHEIASNEAGGNVAAVQRDQRNQVVERLSELTGGSIAYGKGGRLDFNLPGGPTLVAGDSAVGLARTLAPGGAIQINSGGIDVTSNIRGGELGAQLELRDVALPKQLADLNEIAQDLVSRANGLTATATDLNGNPAVNLFSPPAPPLGRAARLVKINPALLSDPSLLGVSSTGAPGDNGVAVQLSELLETSSLNLGNQSPLEFLTTSFTGLGNRIVQADIDENVSNGLVQNLFDQRDAISGVSLDEEAVELTKHQQAYEAAARFMQVLNEVTEIALSLGR